MDDVEQSLKKHLRFINNQRKQITRLQSRVQRLESLLEYSISDPMVKWLATQCQERMDPTVPIFDPGRSAFHLDRYEFASRYVAGKDVADIACGTGYGTEILKESGANHVVGIDVDCDAVAYAKDKHNVAGTEFFCQAGEKTGLASGSVDTVVSFETIEHVEDDSQLLEEFSRILRPSGELIISTPNRWPLEIAPFHVREYDLQGFRTALEPKFEITQMFNQNSGTDFEFNREQPRGIIKTTDSNSAVAECFLAVARKKT
ncbi:MAG: class I SAM-dependent methyltransferase [Planctomycetota bacterium]|nr:class I SAM-dependent methyltransferase [Planctomycetota bacterium]